MSKNFLVLFVRRGYLEVEYILPILKILKKKFMIVTYFEKAKAFNSLSNQKDIFKKWKNVSSNYYIDFLFDNLFLKISLKILLFLDLNNSISNKIIKKIHSLTNICKKLNIEESMIKYILSDYNTHSQKIYQILKKKKRPLIYFFPTSPQIIKAKKKVDKNSRPLLKYIDYLLINSKFEFDYWSNFIIKSKIKITGIPLFYSLKKKKLFKQKNFKILISYNCIEKKYQKKEISNIKRLLKNLIDLNIPIIIKLHPMKQQKYIFDITKELKSDNLSFSTKNLSYLLKDNIKIHICSTKTAAATYSNFYGIPTFGFKQYDHGYDPNSIQIRLKLIKLIKNFRQLRKDILLIVKGDKVIQNQQTASFNNVYQMPKNINNFISNLF
jgi:hypothetical protein